MIPVLNRLLTLEAASSLPDGAGGFVETWVELGRHWAEVRSGTGVAATGDLVALSAVPLKIVVRAAPEGSLARPRPDQRFREGGRVYRILAVSEGDRHGHYLTCFAREEAAS
jgi:head-tail adaptor